jgi:hypothetical protein
VLVCVTVAVWPPSDSYTILPVAKCLLKPFILSSNVVHKSTKTVRRI